jgi:hypothetical protein
MIFSDLPLQHESTGVDDHLWIGVPNFSTLAAFRGTDDHGYRQIEEKG